LLIEFWELFMDELCCDEVEFDVPVLFEPCDDPFCANATPGTSNVAASRAV